MTMEENYEGEYKKVFLELLMILKEKIHLIIVSTVIATMIGWGVASFLVPSQYEASVNMIVNTGTGVTENITNDSISSAQNLVDTYAIIIKSNLVLNDVIDELNLKITYEELYEQVSVSAVNNTQVMEITVRRSSVKEAKEIVETISDIAPKVVADAVGAGSCKVISQVNAGEEQVFPDVKKISIISGFSGFVICVGTIILKGLSDDYVVDDSDVERKLGIPVLGVIPDVRRK